MPNITMDEVSGRIVWTSPSGERFLYSQGDIAWMLAATALVWIMTPGVGYLYSGLLRRKNALSMIFLCLSVAGVVAFQWWVWGFSLAFSDTASTFIGNFKYIGLRGVFENPTIAKNITPRVPSILFCTFHLTFATITPMLAIGAVAERGRLGPSLIFIFIWCTLVYDPIACWTWNSRGWAYKNGVLDFAGGTVVHITSGFTSLAISLFLPKRAGFGTELVYYPAHNTTFVALGTVLMWFGWFGFNGGSALGSTLRAAQASFVTTLAAGMGGLSWMLLDYWNDTINPNRGRRWSVIGFCSGAISALVAITPGSGFVGAPAAALFGVTAGLLCNWASTGIVRLRIDDSLDIFAMHAVGGFVGNILTGFFAQKSVAASDGTIIKGGCIDHHCAQLGWQLANSVAAALYSFTMTAIILWTMHGLTLLFPFLHLSLRCEPEEEGPGMDFLDLNEYGYDYVYLDREPDTKMGMQSPVLNQTGGGGGRELEEGPAAPWAGRGAAQPPPPPPPPPQMGNGNVQGGYPPLAGRVPRGGGGGDGENIPMGYVGNPNREAQAGANVNVNVNPPRRPAGAAAGVGGREQRIPTRNPLL